MKKRFTFSIILVLQLLFFEALPQPSGHNKPALIVYQEAIALFDSPNPTQYTDSLALSKLLYVLRATKPEQSNALIRFNCYYKIGILKQTYNSQRQAATFYQKAIACQQSYNLSDSLLFKPYLYSGLTYYNLSSFDSCALYLEKAEGVLQKYPAQQEAQRLYNSFGALYYEAGNYRQSINYFQKAVQINLRNDRPDKISYTYAYRSNIASALRQMEEFDSAVSIYKGLIPFNLNLSKLLINLGKIYLEKNQPDSTLYYLSKINKVDDYDQIILENALGRAYLQKKNITNSLRHLNRALALQKKEQAQRGAYRKNNNAGLTYKLLADVERQRNNSWAALRHYQQSIIQLDYAFNDLDVYHNPSTDAGGFRNYLLFESLVSKANCLQELYNKQPTAQNRKATIDTYKTALRLAEYIEKSFDSEEAQLFMVRKVFPVYQTAVTFMLLCFEATKEAMYLEEAFRWAEKSKAVALYINTRENEIKSFVNIPYALLKKERDLKFNLSRLKLKLDGATPQTNIASITSEMRDNELALSRLANKLLSYPDYRRKKFSFDSIDVSYLRNSLMEERRAILSYFQSGPFIYCFVMTSAGMRYFKCRQDDAYRQALSAVNAELRTLIPGLAYRGQANARLLYSKLIQPAEQDLRRVNSLIIIPHNELSLLPFDALETKENKYLLEKYNVTYQYAATFLQHGDESKFEAQRTLSFAPFDGVCKTDECEFGRLPASDKEIARLEGLKFRGKEATKKRFLELSRTASVIHLATHAVANSNDPQRSFIAFSTDGDDGGKLYAHELRNTPLSKVHLVFLSACETASGRLIRGEGVMSLSRAFSSAGCLNVITSLWKAEDNATAYISVRFYAYLEQGFSLPEALRKAKLDLLHDGQYAQFHSPQYWSHLVFIGVPDETNINLKLWIGASLFVLAGLIGFWWIRQNNK